MNLVEKIAPVAYGTVREKFVTKKLKESLSRATDRATFYQSVYAVEPYSSALENPGSSNVVVSQIPKEVAEEFSLVKLVEDFAAGVSENLSVSVLDEVVSKDDADVDVVTVSVSASAVRVPTFTMEEVLPELSPEVHDKLTFGRVKYGESFTPGFEGLLYVSVGTRTVDGVSQPAYYVGSTIRDIRQRCYEHKSRHGGRRLDFDPEHILLFSVPKDWARKSDGYKTMLEFLEAMTTYTMNHTLYQKGVWLDNRSYRRSTDFWHPRPVEVGMLYLETYVYPVLEAELGVELVKEPAPEGRFYKSWWSARALHQAQEAGWRAR